MSNNMHAAAPDAMSQLKQGLPLALLLSGVVLVVGVIGFFVYSWMTGVGDLGPIRPTDATTQEETSVDNVAQWLSDARSAVREDRVIQPAGRNALELYLNVLTQDPTNRAAREALTEIIPIATAPAERLIENGDFVEGERVVSLLERADPGSVLVSAMRQKLGLAQQQAAERVRLAEERARTQLEARTAQASAPTPPPPSATPSAADINPLGSNPSVAAARTAAAQPATSTPPPAAASTAAPASTTPPPTVASAAPPPAVAAGTAPQNRNFELIRRVNPQYPARALKQRTEGWVELEFTVTPAGEVADVRVLQAQPRRGEFDREAIRAVQQWKFRPKIENGRPVSATVKQRLNFALGGG